MVRALQVCRLHKDGAKRASRPSARSVPADERGGIPGHEPDESAHIRKTREGWGGSRVADAPFREVVHRDSGAHSGVDR